MTERTKSELLPTLKVSSVEDDENAIQLKDKTQIEILSLKDVATKNGQKTIAVVEMNGEKVQVFVNATSMNNLIDAFGNDDKYFIGKMCDLEIEKAPSPFNKQSMIVFHPQIA
jgi:hypothetical protein